MRDIFISDFLRIVLLKSNYLSHVLVFLTNSFKVINAILHN